MTILVLAGTAEARALCAELSRRGIEAIASLAGVTDSPAPYETRTRTGRFGGEPGLSAWMKEHRIKAVIDATHPFAARMPWNAAAAAARCDLPRLRLLRDPWPAEETWTQVASLTAAADAIPRGAHALLTTGRGETTPFVERNDARFTLRSIEAPGPLPAHITSMIARPPFTLDQELATLALLGITHLVSKNAGGTGRAKLDAARQLGLPVIMIARPSQPNGPVVSTVEAAVAWACQWVENKPSA